MMRTTKELRRLWGPECLPRDQATKVTYDGRSFLVHPATVPAWNELFAVLARHEYSIDEVQDDWSLVCRAITCGTELSLHSFGIAIDINATSNPYGATLITDMSDWMITDIEAIRTQGGVPVFRWGGRYRTNKDAMHFEVVASPDELAGGIQTTGQFLAREEDELTPDEHQWLMTVHHDAGQAKLEAGAARTEAEAAKNAVLALTAKVESVLARLPNG